MKSRHGCACNTHLAQRQFESALLDLHPESFEFPGELSKRMGEWEMEASRNIGERTRWAQQSLNRLMGLRLAVDGVAGPQTRSAIRSFQQRQGLVVDGVVGPKTEAALKAALSALQTGGQGCETLDNFAYDQDQLRPVHNQQIQQIARQVIASQQTSQPIRALRVIGHTDPVGADAYNLALGRRRAERVASQLRAALESVKPGSSRAATLAVESRGERENISADPARNRRVQVCFATAPAACVIAPVTQAEFETPSPRPPLRTVGPAPSIRTCCMLAPAQDPLQPANSNLANPSSLGRHRGSNEVSGIIYTGKAGFIDLGHLRDHCDLTKFIHEQLTINFTPQRVSAVLGEAVMHKCPVSDIQVARAIALDAGLGHEIISYDIRSPGGHNSSFSPEDLCSNFLGTLVAERAIAAGGNFNNAVTTELNNLLRDLGAQTPAESRNAFNRINGRWVDWNDIIGTVSLLDNEYLKRRNFTQTPFKTGHRSDSATPALVTTPLPSFFSVYAYTHQEGGRAMPRSSFLNEIARIQADARRRYGPDFDKP